MLGLTPLRLSPARRDQRGDGQLRVGIAPVVDLKREIAMRDLSNVEAILL
ncbi:MAG: hypothetical protein IPM80_10830 [Proteobacteria bacterium]|nr:hypothetical protein [Pseudomonadota bacterium]